MATRVLIIDDSELILDMLEMVCTEAGYEVSKTDSFTAVPGIVSRETPGVIVSDLNMPDMPVDNDPVESLAGSGIEGIPVIIISGRPQAELDERAAAIGAGGAISKDAGMMGMASTLPDLLAKLT